MSDSDSTRRLINAAYGAIGLAAMVAGALIPALGNVVVVAGLGMLLHAAPSPGRVMAERKAKRGVKSLTSEQPTPVEVPHPNEPTIKPGG